MKNWLRIAPMVDGGAAEAGGVTPEKVLVSKDAARVAASVPFVNRVAPVRDVSGEMCHGETTLAATWAVVSADYLYVLRDLAAGQLSAGRFLSDTDAGEAETAAGRREVVLGARLAEELFADVSTAVGESVTLDGVSFMVVGVVRQSAPSALPTVVRDAYVPVRQVERGAAGVSAESAADGTRLDRIWVEVQGLDRRESVREILQKLFDRLHGDGVIGVH